MELIADALLIAGAAGAAVYCRTLSKRLDALKDLDSGLGAAISALSRQVDELRSSVEAAKLASGDQTREQAQLTARAEMAAGRLELLLASLHENGRSRPLTPRPRPLDDRAADLVAAEPPGEAAAARSDVERLAEARRRLAARAAEPPAARREPQAGAVAAWSDAL